MRQAFQLIRSIAPLGAVLIVTSAAGAQTTAESKAAAAKQETRQEAREAKQETKQAARNTGNAVTDSWITMKVHSQFVPEDALEDSDIDVTTKAGVVTLTGTVATAAGRSRAVAIAKATDGVKSVNDRLRIAPADLDDDDARETAAAGAGAASGAAARTGAAAREGARETGAAAREGARDTKQAARGAGRTVSDGWLTSKIYSQFITEDALEDSDIDVDVNNGVATLTGTVKSQAGISRAAAIAKATDGVKSVNNKLRVGAEK